MAEQVTLQKQVYDKNQYQKVIDNSFTQLGVAVPPTGSVIPILPTVDQFFTYYNQLFYEIPKFGETNSHQYLITTSEEYIGTNNIVNDQINALIEEITELRQENLELQQNLLDLVRANQNNG